MSTLRPTYVPDFPLILDRAREDALSFVQESDDLPTTCRSGLDEVIRDFALSEDQAEAITTQYMDVFEAKVEELREAARDSEYEALVNACRAEEMAASLDPRDAEDDDFDEAEAWYGRNE